MILLNLRQNIKGWSDYTFSCGKDDIAYAPRKIPTLIIHINSQVIEDYKIIPIN